MKSQINSSLGSQENQYFAVLHKFKFFLFCPVLAFVQLFAFYTLLLFYSLQSLDFIVVVILNSLIFLLFLIHNSLSTETQTSTINVFHLCLEYAQIKRNRNSKKLNAKLLANIIINNWSEATLLNKKWKKQ